MEFAKTIRSNYPDIKIATGGIHPTTYPREILENCSDIDFVAIGEGEGQMLALANCIENDDLDGVTKINQFAYRTDSGDVHINKEFPQLLNMDELPMPAWDLIELSDYQMDLDHFYNPKKLKITNRVPIFSSRGCPLPCNFCDMFLVMGKKHRRSSAVRMVDELEFLNKNYGMNYFSIMDDNLTLQKKHIVEICDEINRRKLNIQWETPNGVMVNSLKLFEQVKRDNLLVESVDYENLWQTPISHAQHGFVIKPYNMSIDELIEWRVRLHAVNDKYKGYNKKQWESSSANGSSTNGVS